MDSVEVGTDPVLNLSFIVREAFKPDMEEAIKSGIPTSFTFYVELYRVRGMWFDKSVATWEFKHEVKYDNLKQEYIIALEEGAAGAIRTKDFAEMKRLMVTGEHITFVPTPFLRPGTEYYLRLMAELDTVKLPFLLRHMLFFVKYWDFETDWHSVHFVR